MAQVLDRLFLWIFTVAVLVGTAGIIFQVKKYVIHRGHTADKVNIIGRMSEKISLVIS